MVQEVTPKMIAALSRLRVHARLHSNPQSLRDAIDALDNSGVFAPIDQASNYGTETN